MNTRLENKGFTLLELMIVVVIIGVLAAIAIPNVIRMKRHYDLRNASELIFTDMMKARSQAISNYVDYTILFNTAANTFSVQKGTQAAVTDPNSSAWTDISFYTDNSDSQVSPLSSNEVLFYTDGSAGFNDDNTGYEGTGTTGYEAVYIMNNPDTGERLRVKVLSATGKITTEKWNGGAWASGF